MKVSTRKVKHKTKINDLYVKQFILFKQDSTATGQHVHTFRTGHGGRLTGPPMVVPYGLIGALHREEIAADNIYLCQAEDTT